MSQALENQFRFCLKIAIVAGITALVIAMVLPVVGPLPFFPRSDPERRIAVEITRLEAALKSFRLQYGVYPPDNIAIREDGGHWDALSRSVLRQIWPQFDFETPQDLNRDGDTIDIHVLNGAECLVFFLGGTRSTSKNKNPIGFSKNPGFPFDTRDSTRDGPYFEFDGERFTDVDDDGFYEFADPWNSNGINPAPYLYIVRQHGNRFHSRGLAVYTGDDSDNMQQPYDVDHRILNYQIISPGLDGQYGCGGEYVADETVFVGKRSTEADHITNFAQGTLAR